MSNSDHFFHVSQTLLIQDRVGLKIASRLSDAAEALPHDISERLRVARKNAVGARKAVSVQFSRGLVGALTTGTSGAEDEDISLWNRIAAMIPLVVLLAGLLAIHVVQNDNRASELAEIDSALLTDDLPPGAFTDPGFAQFLKANRGN